MTTQNPSILLKRIDKTTKLPQKNGSGCILFATTSYTLKPGCKILMPTGVSMAIPPTYYGQLHILNDHIGKLKLLGGVIDSDYRGQMNAILYNMSEEDYNFAVGDPVCKILFVKIYDGGEMVEVDCLNDSARGDSGFGSTGK